MELITLTTAFIIFCCILSYHESFATLSFLFSVFFVVQFWKYIPLWTPSINYLIGLSIPKIILLIISYFGIGIFWGRFKYGKYFGEMKEKVINRQKVINIHKSMNEEERIQNIKTEMSYYSPSRRKGDIVGWISYWPLSVFVYITFDFFTEIGKRIWGMVSGMFESFFQNQIDKIK